MKISFRMSCMVLASSGISIVIGTTVDVLGPSMLTCMGWFKMVARLEMVFEHHAHRMDLWAGSVVPAAVIFRSQVLASHWRTSMSK